MRGTSQPQPRPRRRARLLLPTLILLAVVLPAGYVVNTQWQSTSAAAEFVTTERTGVAFAAPLTVLLASLVDAQSAAAHGSAVDVNGIRDAVGQVNRVDLQQNDAMALRQGWSQLTGQIDAVLGQRASAQDALRLYAVPIGLTQALLVKIGDYSKIVRDSELDAYHLMETALFRVPEVLVSAGQVSVLALSVDPKARASGVTDPRIAVAQDHIATAAASIGVGLRSSAVDLALLKRLDEFSAAADALAHASTGDLSSPAAQAAVENARHRLHQAALDLEAAALGAFDSLLAKRADSLATQVWIVLIAGILILLAAVVLFWLRQAGTAAPLSPASNPLGGRQPGTLEPSPLRPSVSPDLVDARQLIGPEAVQRGRPVRTHRREEHNAPR